MDFEKVPMTPAGVGGGGVTRWTYSTYGDFLSIYGIRNRISVTFNLKSSWDIESKIAYLEQMRDKGLCSTDDISEVKERLRTLSNLTLGGVGGHVLESEVKTKTVYRDGQECQVTVRGSSGKPSEAQIRAAENARQFAHTDEANKKRRKSISARNSRKLMKEI